MPGNHENLVSGADEWSDQDRRRHNLSGDGRYETQIDPYLPAGQKAPLSSYDATCSYLVAQTIDVDRSLRGRAALWELSSSNQLAPVRRLQTHPLLADSLHSMYFASLDPRTDVVALATRSGTARKVKTVGMANRIERPLRAAKPTLGQCWKNHVMVHEDEDEDPQLGFAASSSKYLKAALIGVWMLFYCGALWGASALSTNQPPLHPKNRGTKQPPALGDRQCIRYLDV
ncbi:unnamed protein product [Clonostachys rosea f. rosea IK726]|uniref:Uncharacterized protein n=1 Tax=Clonostachys rosea f. rosea IK726 TaxID=1349383 RepID=A0ACA9UL55_BIOOC|nr:unnamed protein product [Clonostachys rosea f. rosea IK726]